MDLQLRARVIASEVQPPESRLTATTALAGTGSCPEPLLYRDLIVPAIRVAMCANHVDIKCTATTQCYI